MTFFDYEIETRPMIDMTEQNLQPPLFRLSFKLFVVWTIFSALATWFGLSIAEGLAKERCNEDGQGFVWTSWSCAPRGGTIIVPPNLRRAGSD